MNEHENSHIARLLGTTDWTIVGGWNESDDAELGECWRYKRHLRDAGFGSIPIRVEFSNGTEPERRLYLFIVGLDFATTNAPDACEQVDAQGIATRAGLDPATPIATLDVITSRDAASPRELHEALTVRATKRFGPAVSPLQIHELTRVPLHCAHTLRYPYVAGCALT